MLLIHLNIYIYKKLFLRETSRPLWATTLQGDLVWVLVYRRVEEADLTTPSSSPTSWTTSPSPLTGCRRSCTSARASSNAWSSYTCWWTCTSRFPCSSASCAPSLSPTRSPRAVSSTGASRSATRRSMPPWPWLASPCSPRAPRPMAADEPAPGPDPEKRQRLEKRQRPAAAQMLAQKPFPPLHHAVTTRP